jgi:hypothetical protein
MQFSFVNIVTYSLKARILEPEETAVAREWPLNTFLWQVVHERNNRGIVGGCVFHAVHAEAI